MKNILIDIGKEYNKKCDEYDEKVCSGRNKFNEPIPIGRQEIYLVNTFAKHQRRIAYDRGIKHGFTQQEVMNSIKENSIL